MPSPVTASDFDISNYAGDVCGALSQLLANNARLKEWFGWAFSADGSEVTAEFAALFAPYNLPIGSAIWTPVASIPSNCVKADGRSLNRAHSAVGVIDGYPELFSVYGTFFGTDSTTTFKIPDLQGRFLFGSSPGHAVQEEGGEESHQLVAAELPEHDHAPAIDTNKSSGETGENPAIRTGDNQGNGYDQSAGNNDATWGSGGKKTGFTTISSLLNKVTGLQSVGSDAPHNNMPPFMVGTWVIKAR